MARIATANGGQGRALHGGYGVDMDSRAMSSVDRMSEPWQVLPVQLESRRELMPEELLWLAVFEMAWDDLWHRDRYKRQTAVSLFNSPAADWFCGKLGCGPVQLREAVKARVEAQPEIARHRASDWTEAENAVLRDHYGDWNYARIGHTMGRSWSAVAARATRMGLTKRTRRGRPERDDPRAAVAA